MKYDYVKMKKEREGKKLKLVITKSAVAPRLRQVMAIVSSEH